MERVSGKVPVDADVTSELIEHIRNKTTDQAESTLSIPTWHFTSKERLDAEIALMKTLPIMAAHICEIKNPGDYVAREILGVPVLIVRQRDGEVATFRNMCRHRGGMVETQASGNKHAFMCQYHGWSYDAEGGGLKPVFYEDTFGPIDYACKGLLRIKTDVRHGLIFLTLSNKDGEPIDEYFGPGVDSQIAPWGLDGATLFLDQSYTLPINWKLVMDGTIDSLHAQFLHPKPGGVGSRTINNRAVFRNYGRHGKMFMARNKMKKLIDSGGDLAASSEYVSSVMTLYPNVAYVNAPDHVEFWSVWPSLTNPAECTIQFRFFVRPEILTPEMTDRINKSWEILSLAGLEEDFPMEETIQKNAQAWPDGAFTYGLNEKSAQHLHRQLRKDLGS